MERMMKAASKSISWMECRKTLPFGNDGSTQRTIIGRGNEPVLFDHDCREGICGTCSLTINGFPHGPENSTTTCQLHMRKFNDGETITIEPFRARAFPVVRDLVVDRSAFDRITQAGGYITVRTGSAPMEMLCRYPKMIRTKQWMLQHVSVVGLVLLPKCICDVVHFGQSGPPESASTRTGGEG